MKSVKKNDQNIAIVINMIATGATASDVFSRFVFIKKGGIKRIWQKRCVARHLIAALKRGDRNASFLPPCPYKNAFVKGDNHPVFIEKNDNFRLCEKICAKVAQCEYYADAFAVFARYEVFEKSYFLKKQHKFFAEFFILHEKNNSVIPPRWVRRAAKFLPEKMIATMSGNGRRMSVADAVAGGYGKMYDLVAVNG